MQGYQTADQRQIQVANALAKLLYFCVDVSLRLIGLSRKQARTDSDCQPPHFLELARGRLCRSNRVRQSTHYRSYPVSVV
jgi:hypothetical protein